MSTLKVIQIQHPSAASAALTLDSSGNLSTSGALTFPAGSASAPAIQGPSDPNTGLFFPAADTIAFAEGGTEVLRIDSSGRLGLGTSSPSTKLHVNSADSSATYLRVENTSGQAYFGVDGSGNTYAGAETNDAFGLVTNGSYRMYITSGGNVGVGDTAPGYKLVVAGEMQMRGGDNTTFRIYNTTAGFQSLALYADSTVASVNAGVNNLALYSAGTERARIDGSGRLLVGTSSARTSLYGAIAPIFQIEGTSYQGTCASIIANGATDNANPRPLFVLGRTRGSSGSNTSVANNDLLGDISFQGADGTQLHEAARIRAEIDGTPGTNDMPGRLVFYTTADGASSPTERMRIANDGNIYWAKTVDARATKGLQFNNSAGVLQVTTEDTRVLDINRQTNDGDLVLFFQANTQEGAISVSGTTVTYGGGHIARWSQLPDEEDPSTLLKGTVMSNLDEMCEWGEEDNEQLNKTKVSDVEGDSNVAGVFVSPASSDDGPLDFWLAMTGDMIIRIAEGVTVQRGQLLMSAGDGTAKPQGDGFVQDKTVAKVTSTHVTCTYEDGSYCVPCVLMAC